MESTQTNFRFAPDSSFDISELAQSNQDILQAMAIRRMKAYLESSPTVPSFLKQVANYPDYVDLNDLNLNATDMRHKAQQAQAQFQSQYQTHGNIRTENLSTSPTSKYKSEAVESQGMRATEEPSGSSRLAGLFPTTDVKADLELENEIDCPQQTDFEYTRLGHLDVSIKSTADEYISYFENLSTRNNITNTKNANTGMDSVNKYFERHRLFKPVGEGDIDRSNVELSTGNSIENSEVNTASMNTRENSVEPAPCPTMAEEFVAKFYLDADKFQTCITPNVFSPVKIPSIAYNCMQKMWNGIYLFGGIVKMEDLEYYNYLFELTDDFTIPPENIKLIFDYDLPVPLNAYLLTSLSVKLNDIVYKYSPGSNTLSVLMKLLNQRRSASVSSTNSTMDSMNENSTSSSKKRYKHPPQLVSMSCTAISKYHIAMYGGFELITDTLKYTDPNGAKRVELTKRIVPHNQAYILDIVNLSFKEIDLTVPPLYSSLSAETISRFGQGLNGLTVEENNMGSDQSSCSFEDSTMNTNTKYSDMDLQLSDTSLIGSGHNSRYSSYTKPALIYCFGGYKMVESTSTDKEGNEKVTNTFVALNDLWQVEIYLSKTSNAFEFSDEMIVFPIGKFNLLYTPFNGLFTKNKNYNPDDETSKENEYEMVDDWDSVEGYEKFDPEYNKLPQSESRKRKFTGIYDYRDGNWPSPRAYYSFEIVDKSLILDGLTDLSENLTSSPTLDKKGNALYPHASHATTGTDLSSQSGVESTNLFHPQPKSHLPLQMQSQPVGTGIQRKPSPAMSAISNSFLQHRSSPPAQKSKKQTYSSLLSDDSTTSPPVDSSANNSSNTTNTADTSVLRTPVAVDSEAIRRFSESSYNSSSGHVFSPTSGNATLDNSHMDNYSSSNYSDGVNARNIQTSVGANSKSGNLLNKYIMIHGGSSKKYYKNLSTGEVYYKNDILGDIWLFSIASEKWFKLDTFAHPNLYDGNSKLFTEKTEDSKEDVEDTKYSHIPKGMNSLTNPVKFEFCGHQTVVSGSNYFLLGGFYKDLFHDHVFFFKKLETLQPSKNINLIKLLHRFDEREKSELSSWYPTYKEDPIDMHKLLQTQIDRKIIPSSYFKKEGMVYRTYMLHLNKQTWKLMDFFTNFYLAKAPEKHNNTGFTPGVALFEDRLVLIGGLSKVGKDDEFSGLVDWIGECYTPVLTLS